MAEVVAVVDIGSNSLHLQVVRGDEVLAVDRAAVRLGDLVDENIPLQALKAAGDALSAFDAQARGLGALSLRCFATAALRDAHNRDEALALLPCPVRVLTGEEEAALAWKGVRRRLPLEGPLVVFDLGGRSTEVVEGEGDTVHRALSLPFGHISLTRGRVPDLSQVKGMRGRVVGTAGTALTLATMAAVSRGEQPTSRHGLYVSTEELEDLVARLATPEAPNIPGVDLRRIDTLPAGGRGVLALVRALAAPGFTSCEGGLREGLVAWCQEGAC